MANVQRDTEMAQNSTPSRFHTNGNERTGERQTSLRWDVAAVEALASVDHVWSVQITDGRGNLVERAGRRETPAVASVAIDLAMHAMAQCGAQLKLGDAGILAQVFAGGLLVAIRVQDGATVSVMASSQANLGQLLIHVRKLSATFQEVEAAQ